MPKVKHLPNQHISQVRIEHDLAISAASSVVPLLPRHPPVTLLSPSHPLSPIQIESPSCTALELCARNWADVALKTMRLGAIDNVVCFMFGKRDVVLCGISFMLWCGVGAVIGRWCGLVMVLGIRLQDACIFLKRQCENWRQSMIMVFWFAFFFFGILGAWREWECLDFIVLMNNERHIAEHLNFILVCVYDQNTLFRCDKYYFLKSASIKVFVLAQIQSYHHENNIFSP